MKMKSLMLLLVAAGFGLVAMLGVMQVLNGKTDEEPAVRVAVALTDIPAGMPLDDTNVGFKEFPKSAVPSGAVINKEEFAGKCLISRAVPGEILMSAKLGGAESITASHQIPKGMRVATVSVNATKSHSGLIRPTDRVDIVCTYEVPNPLTRQKSTHVKTVLEFIEVFAVDSMREGREGDVDTTVKNVSLLVDPEQFQLLKAAEGLGELSLSLRNRNDAEKTQVGELSDSIFFARDTSEGNRQTPRRPTAAPTQTADAEGEGSGLSEFLTSAMTAMAEATTVSTASTAESPTWVMTICRGTAMEDVEVLDEKALPSTMTPAERQRVRREARNAASDNEKNKKKPAAAAPGFTPAPAAQPAASAPAAGSSSTAQASSAPAAPPAFLPLLPYGE